MKRIAGSKIARCSLTVAAVVMLSGGVTATSAIAGEPCVPQWDNTIGQPGMESNVNALAVYKGELIAGGTFITAGGVTANRIARWDGSSWSSLGSGMTNNGVNALATLY